MRAIRSAVATLSLVGGLLTCPVLAQDDLQYDEPFFPGSSHDDAISTPEEILGFAMGERPAEHAEIEACFLLWDEQSERALLQTHGETFEGRTLYHMVISSPANLARLDGIRGDLARLADPRGLSDEDAAALLERVPAVAWMAYSIHGDELSGADAGLAAAWHYLSATGDDVETMREDLVIIIDPMMNPDGRDRYLGQLREMRGKVPTTDDQARLHGGRWPRGRTNHYMFDLNRDWTLGVNPETRGRIRAIRDWHPLLLVDAHEMGGQDTYLFSPSREPINPNYSGHLHEWLNVFAGDQAGAFDEAGWRYYTGEWADDWYPGYTNAWAAFRGAIGILYEQAGVDWYGVKRPEGRVLTYRESVHHQLRSTLANIRTLYKNRDAIREGWLATSRESVAPDGPYANRSFAILPSENRSRVGAFVDLMELQGFEMFELTRSFTASGTDRLGREQERIELPAGTILIPNRQPNARLLATMLEFDPHMSEAFLAKERRELVRTGSTEIYDITGWSTPMMHDLEAYELAIGLPREFVAPFDGFDGFDEIEAGVDRREAKQAWIIAGADDQTPALAMELMRAGVAVRFADEDFTWGNGSFGRGSLVVTRADQARDGTAWLDTLDALCEARGLAAHGVETGLGAGDIADIGGEHFDLLAEPKIAVLGEAPVSAYDFGSIWYTLDERYKLPATYLSAANLRFTDLRRYNVLVLPSGAGSEIRGAMDDLRRWVESGGTLIAIGSSASALAREGGLSSARDLSDVLGDLDAFEIAVLREWAADAERLDSDQVWSHDAAGGEPSYPWAGVDLDRGSSEELERRDRWQRQFMPPGTIVAARVDDEHWLTAGCGEYLPMLYSSGTVLMVKDGVEAPLRYGVIDDDPSASEARRIGWSTIPAGKTLLLRMSGLLWPEAAHRIANGAPVTRERVGMGQVILFADSPTFRATALGTTRVFMNALVYGPGLGASQPIDQ